MSRTNAEILKGDNPLYYKSFGNYTPRAVYVENTRSYGWLLSNATAEEIKAYDDKADDVQWQPALASEGSCIILSETFLMTRERAQAEAEEIAKNLKAAAKDW
jgi:hypothetical protein